MFGPSRRGRDDPRRPRAFAPARPRLGAARRSGGGRRSSGV